jgi:hypothetical protein
MGLLFQSTPKARRQRTPRLLEDLCGGGRSSLQFAPPTLTSLSNELRSLSMDASRKPDDNTTCKTRAACEDPETVHRLGRCGSSLTRAPPSTPRRATNRTVGHLCARLPSAPPDTRHQALTPGREIESVPCARQEVQRRLHTRRATPSVGQGRSPLGGTNLTGCWLLRFPRRRTHA